MKRSARIEAEPCPFCGNEKIDCVVSVGKSSNWIWIECATCGARTRALAVPFLSDTMDAMRKRLTAVNNWNARADT